MFSDLYRRNKIAKCFNCELIHSHRTLFIHVLFLLYFFFTFGHFLEFTYSQKTRDFSLGLRLNAVQLNYNYTKGKQNEIPAVSPSHPNSGKFFLLNFSYTKPVISPQTYVVSLHSQPVTRNTICQMIFLPLEKQELNPTS